MDSSGVEKLRKNFSVGGRGAGEEDETDGGTDGRGSARVSLR